MSGEHCTVRTTLWVFRTEREESTTERNMRSKAANLLYSKEV